MDDHATVVFAGKGNLRMAGPVLIASKPQILETIQMSGSNLEISASLRAPLPSKSTMQKASIASASGLGCVRGTTLALGFEAGLGLGIYALWQLWEFFR